MRSIEQLKAFCKTQRDYHARKAADQKLQPYQSRKHREAAEGLGDLATLLDSLPAQYAPSDDVGFDLFDLDPFRMADIPSAFIDELKISRAEKSDARILELFRFAGRPLNISEVLIGLYRKFDETMKRTAVSARLYRLARDGHLESVDGGRGVYRLPEKAKPAIEAGFKVSEAR
jgi:hypothetical protein